MYSLYYHSKLYGVAYWNVYHYEVGSMQYLTASLKSRYTVV